MNEMLFDIVENLCIRYSCLHPFEVRRQRAGEVFRILFLILDKADREKRKKLGLKKGDTTYVDNKGRTHIRRESTDDSFW